MKDDFKKAAAAEIAAFKAGVPQAQPRRRRREDRPTSELLREVMNTVGKQGRLGEQVRCVVSVSMLTEGWDANTVTHILGVRAFGSQLLCEQVVGRGLRRRSYAVNDEGMFEPEYANVYGIPFQFISSDKPIKDPLPPKPVDRGLRRRGPRAAADQFPKLDGYRVELPDEEIWLDLDDAPEFEIGPNTVPTLGRDGRRRRRARARGGRPDAVPPAGGRLRSRQAHPRRQLQHRRRQAPVALPEAGRDVPGVDRAEGRRHRRLQPRLPDDDHRGAGCSPPSGLERDHPAGGQPPRAAAPDDQPLRPRRLDRRRRLPDPQARPCRPRSPRSPTSPSTARTATPGSSSSRASSS